jgi:hypothetical protein
MLPRSKRTLTYCHVCFDPFFLPHCAFLRFSEIFQSFFVTGRLQRQCIMFIKRCKGQVTHTHTYGCKNKIYRAMAAFCKGWLTCSFWQYNVWEVGWTFDIERSIFVGEITTANIRRESGNALDIHQPCTDPPYRRISNAEHLYGVNTMVPVLHRINAVLRTMLEMLSTDRSREIRRREVNLMLDFNNTFSKAHYGIGLLRHSIDSGATHQSDHSYGDISIAQPSSQTLKSTDYWHWALWNRQPCHVPRTWSS